VTKEHARFFVGHVVERDVGLAAGVPHCFVVDAPACGKDRPDAGVDECSDTVREWEEAVRARHGAFWQE